LSQALAAERREACLKAAAQRTAAVTQVAAVGGGGSIFGGGGSSIAGGAAGGGGGGGPFGRAWQTLPTGPWPKPGASSCTRKRLSLTGARAKAWCLLILEHLPLLADIAAGQGFALCTPVFSVKWQPMTRRAISVRPLATAAAGLRRRLPYMLPRAFLVAAAVAVMVGGRRPVHTDHTVKRLQQRGDRRTGSS
jgi:hypothetical protein